MHLMRCAALISFMAARTFMSGSMSVTSVWMIMKPKEDMDLVSCSLTSCAISSFVWRTHQGHQERPRRQSKAGRACGLHPRSNVTARAPICSGHRTDRHRDKILGKFSLL